MPEVLTCKCGDQSDWRIFGGRAMCTDCGREFQLVFGVNEEGGMYVDVAKTNRRIKRVVRRTIGLRRSRRGDGSDVS